MGVHLHLHLLMCVFIWVCLYGSSMGVFICICVCDCVCVCVYVCIRRLRFCGRWQQPRRLCRAMCRSTCRPVRTPRPWTSCKRILQRYVGTWGEWGRGEDCDLLCAVPLVVWWHRILPILLAWSCWFTRLTPLLLWRRWVGGVFFACVF